jgi:hypothetical protein
MGGRGFEISADRFLSIMYVDISKVGVTLQRRVTLHIYLYMYTNNHTQQKHRTKQQQKDTNNNTLGKNTYYICRQIMVFIMCRGLPSSDILHYGTAALQSTSHGRLLMVGHSRPPITRGHMTSWVRVVVGKVMRRSSSRMVRVVVEGAQDGLLLLLLGVSLAPG